MKNVKRGRLGTEQASCTLLKEKERYEYAVMETVVLPAGDVITCSPPTVDNPVLEDTDGDQGEWD